MRTYKRIIAMLVTISMVLSVLPQFAVTVWADDSENDANVSVIWGIKNGDDVNVESLVIADAAPDEGYTVVAKFIDGGDYEATESDIDIKLLINNSNVDAQKFDDLSLDYYLSGESEIAYPNIIAHCNESIIPEFDGDAADVADIAQYYSPDKYSGWDEELQHFNFVKYNYLITGEFHGGLDASNINVAKDAKLVVDCFYIQDKDIYGINTVNTNNLMISGEVIIEDSESKGAPFANEINIVYKLIVEDGGSITATGNGRLSFEPHASFRGVGLYDTELEPWNSPNADSRASFEYKDIDGGKYWMIIPGNEDEPEYGDNQVVVFYDEYPYFDDEAGANINHTGVYVNDRLVRSGDPVDFEVGKPIEFKLSQYREYDLDEIMVSVHQGTGVEDEFEDFSTITEDADHLITLEQDGDLVKFTFTPTRSNTIFVDVYWAEIDTLQPEKGQISFDIYAWGEVGGKGELSGVEPVEYVEATNGTIRAIYNRKDIEDGGEISVKFTPDKGADLTYLSYNIDSRFYGEFGPDYMKDSGLRPFSQMEGLVVNDDGTYTFTIDSFEPYEDDRTFFSISAGFDNPLGYIGFQIDPNRTAVSYSLDGGAFAELETIHHQDEWGEWDEMFLDPEVIGDADSVTFKFDVDERDRDWRVMTGVRFEYFDNAYHTYVLPFDDMEACTFTVEKPQDGWCSYKITALEGLVAYDNTYVIYVEGEWPEDFKIDEKALDVPVQFTVGEPVEIKFEGEAYKVCVREINGVDTKELTGVNGVYSYTPVSTSGVEFHIYLTKDAYDVDYMWPEGENERTLDFWVNNDGFPEDVPAGSVELLENDHIKRFASSCGHYRFIVEYDPEEVENEPAIIGFKLNVPEKCEFSVWLNGNDLTPMVYQKYEETGEYILELDITGRITRWEPFNLDINFAYHEFGADELVVHYDSRYYPDEDNTEGRPHAELIVNGERIDPNSSVKFNVGEEITFKLVPPEEYENYDFDLAMVRIHQWDDENNEEEFFDSEFDNDHKIVISSTGEFKFTPTRWGTIFVDVDWSAFDAIHTEGDQVQIELNRWGNGTISFGDMIDPVAFAESPYGDGRTRAVFNASDLDGEGKIEVIFTPDYGYVLNKVVFDNSGFDHTEYVLDPNDPNGYPISELDGFVDNEDGTYTYTIDTFDIAEPDEWNNSFININADFGNPLGCEGVSIDSKGAKVYYKLDGDEDFTELPVREFTDEWNTWEEIRLTPEEFMDSSTVTFKFVFEDGRIVEGVELCYYENGERRSYRPFYDPSNYEYVLTKPEEGWANYRLTLMDYVAPFDGQYVIYALGEDAEEIKIEGYNLGQTLNFTLGKPITFSFDHDVYGVYLTNKATYEEIELIPENGVYSYTPDSYDPLEFQIFMTEVEFELCHLHAEGEYEREVEFWIDRWDFPEGADIGDVIIPENANVKKWINSCGHVKLIVEWEGLSPEGAFIDLTVKVPEFTELHIWENGGEADAQVVDGTCVYVWDISGVYTGREWSSPRFVLQYLPGITLMDMPEGVGAEYSTDGGSTYQPVDGDRINLYEDMHSVKLRFVEQNEDVTVYGINYFVGNQAYRERLNADLVYDFERGEHWISYFVVPVVTDSMFDNEWTYEFAMPEDKDIVVFKNNVSDGINNFGKFSTVTIKADNVYCIEAVNVYGEIRKFSKSGNTFKLVMNDAAGFTAYIYTSKEEYEFVNLEPVGEQYHVYYYSDSESEQTGTVSVAGEVARKSYNGMTKVIFNAEEPTAVFTITPADNYYYTATRDGEAFSGTVDLSEWDIDWPVIEFVQKTDISGATVTLDPAGDQIYTGSAITPAVKVTLNNVELTADEDYTVAYSNNVEAGVATVTVTGTGKFSGIATTTFNIVKAVYTVSVVCSDNGTATVSKTSANEGDVITVTATPGSDFELDTIKVDGTAIEGTTFTMPGKDVTVTVTFKQKVYTVTVSETSNGTVTVSKSTASAGDVITVTATPADGYSLDVIKVNGTAIEGTTFTMPAQAVTVEVTFKKNAPAKNGWILDNGKYYYYDNGVMVTGWKSSGGKWYYMDPETGIMVTGWLDLDGTWYYLNGSGAMLTGWQQVRGKWYYFENSGAMKTGWLSDGGKWYYLTSSGAMATGWQQAGGEWYYFESSGAMTETGWKEIGGKWYYFKKSGAMAFKEYCGGYWLNEDGSWTYPHKASWRGNDESGWWYGDDSGWYANNEKLTIDGKVYEFDARGYWIKNRGPLTDTGNGSKLTKTGGCPNRDDLLLFHL